MSWRAHVETDRFGRQVIIYLGQEATGALYAFKPVTTERVRVEEGSMSSPFLHLDEAAARALYEALGSAFNEFMPDMRFAADVLKREQSRVDKLLDHLVRETT